MKTFRIIETEEYDGITNMAIDEAIFINYKHNKIPVLRIYGWKLPAISIGRFQNINNLFKDNNLNYQIVRRITGGGAIIHHNEITYSIICSPEDIEIDRVEVKKGFKILTEFLIKTYRDFKIKADYAISNLKENIVIKTQLCFAGKEEYDIVVDNKKIGGNAQKRGKDIIFQHGSIPVNMNYQLFNEVFNKEFIPDFNSITSLSEYLNKDDIVNFRERLKINFQDSLHIRGINDNLSKEEEYLKDILIKEKYSNKEWNFYGKETRMA